MKKVLLFFAVFTMMALTSCMIDLDSRIDYSVADDSRTVVTFLHSPTCNYSKAAREYIEQTYPNAAIRYIDIDLEGNKRYLKAAQQDYGLGSFIQTPVICFGNNHIEGWDYNKRLLLDDYILPYLKEQ